MSAGTARTRCETRISVNGDGRENGRTSESSGLDRVVIGVTSAADLFQKIAGLSFTSHSDRIANKPFTIMDFGDRHVAKIFGLKALSSPDPSAKDINILIG